MATADSNSLPLHRICTLARKQRASRVLVESVLERQDIREEIDALDLHMGGGGEAEAIALTFFNSQVEPFLIEEAPAETLLGQAILINYRASGASSYTQSYVFEAVIAPPSVSPDGNGRIALLNNFICSDGEFRISAGGRDFVLRAIYYCQQNSITHVCAHACLRMALNSMDLPSLTNVAINQQLGVTDAASGLSIGQIENVASSVNGVQAAVWDCSLMQPAS